MDGTNEIRYETNERYRNILVSLIVANGGSIPFGEARAYVNAEHGRFRDFLNDTKDIFNVITLPGKKPSPYSPRCMIRLQENVDPNKYIVPLVPSRITKKRLDALYDHMNKCGGQMDTKNISKMFGINRIYVSTTMISHISRDPRFVVKKMRVEMRGKNGENCMPMSFIVSLSHNVIDVAPPIHEHIEPSLLDIYTIQDKTWCITDSAI